MAIEQTIASLGYQAIGTAASLNQARDHLANVDLALADVNLLDGTSGIRVAQELAAGGATIIFMTANPEAVTAKVDGALGVLAKPVDDGDLAQVLKFAIKRRAGRNPSFPKCLKAIPA
jgi:DNA-binding response OmpR family regulator